MLDPPSHRCVSMPAFGDAGGGGGLWLGSPDGEDSGRAEPCRRIGSGGSEWSDRTGASIVAKSARHPTSSADTVVSATTAGVQMRILASNPCRHEGKTRSETLPQQQYSQTIFRGVEYCSIPGAYYYYYCSNRSKRAVLRWRYESATRLLGLAVVVAAPAN